jgi:hypothetical protein
MIQQQTDTLTPRVLIDGYERAYKSVYGRTPNIQHVGGQWYYVNGETVHRLALMAEIGRLREQMQQRQSRYQPEDRSVVQRLIARLRGL